MPGEPERVERATLLPEASRAASMHHGSEVGPGPGELLRPASLVGMAMPSAGLRTVGGLPASLDQIVFGWVVYYFYPGIPEPGALARRDSVEDAAEHRVYGKRQKEFSARGVRVVGISSQTPDEQLGTAFTNGVPPELLNDQELAIADMLGLPTFEHDGRRWYERLTLITFDRVIEHVFYPVERAARNADQALAWIRMCGV